MDSFMREKRNAMMQTSIMMTTAQPNARSLDVEMAMYRKDKFATITTPMIKIIALISVKRQVVGMGFFGPGSNNVMMEMPITMITVLICAHWLFVEIKLLTAKSPIPKNVMMATMIPMMGVYNASVPSVEMGLLKRKSNSAMMAIVKTEMIVQTNAESQYAVTEYYGVLGQEKRSVTMAIKMITTVALPLA